MKSPLVRAWGRGHERRVDVRDRQIRLDSLPVATWDAEAGRFVSSPHWQTGLSEERLEALLHQVCGMPADEIALMIEVRLKQLGAG